MYTCITAAGTGGVVYAKMVVVAVVSAAWLTVMELVPRPVITDPAGKAPLA
jgi:hypothetical protein